MAMLLLEKGNYMFSFDLKSGYCQRALEVSGVLMGIPVLCFYGSPVWPLVGMLYIHQAGAPPGEVLAGEGPQSHCVLG